LENLPHLIIRRDFCDAAGTCSRRLVQRYLIVIAMPQRYLIVIAMPRPEGFSFHEELPYQSDNHGQTSRDLLDKAVNIGTNASWKRSSETRCN
jgi:hypothetical protein